MIPNQQLNPLGCLRSDHNYPHLVALSLSYSAFRDVSCSGAKEKELNAMLGAQAGANAAYCVDTYAPSIGHDACKGNGTKWVEPVVPTSLAAPVHSNATGMQALAGIVLAHVRAVGWSRRGGDRRRPGGLQRARGRGSVPPDRQPVETLQALGGQ